jgi:hypothetical protein
MWTHPKGTCYLWPIEELPIDHQKQHQRSVLIPRATILSGPLKHFQVTPVCRTFARVLIPRASIIPSCPLKKFQVTIYCSNSARSRPKGNHLFPGTLEHASVPFVHPACMSFHHTYHPWLLPAVKSPRDRTGPQHDFLERKKALNEANHLFRSILASCSTTIIIGSKILVPSFAVSSRKSSARDRDSAIERNLGRNQPFKILRIRHSVTIRGTLLLETVGAAEASKAPTRTRNKTKARRTDKLKDWIRHAVNCEKPCMLVASTSSPVFRRNNDRSPWSSKSCIHRNRT